MTDTVSTFPPAAPNGAVQTFESIVIDMTAVTSNIELVPAKPGYYFEPSPFANCLRFRVVSAGGTYTTNPTLNCGNNVTKDNVFASAAYNAAAAKAQGAGSLQSIGGANPMLCADMTTSIKVDVTVGATGAGLALTGRFWIAGTYVLI